MKMSSKIPRGFVSDEYKKRLGFKGSKKKIICAEKHVGWSKNETRISSVIKNVGDFSKKSGRKSSFNLKLHKMCSFDL